MKLVLARVVLACLSFVVAVNALQTGHDQALTPNDVFLQAAATKRVFCHCDCKCVYNDLHAVANGKPKYDASKCTQAPTPDFDLHAPSGAGVITASRNEQLVAKCASGCTAHCGSLHPEDKMAETGYLPCKAGPHEVKCKERQEDAFDAIEKDAAKRGAKITADRVAHQSSLPAVTFTSAVLDSLIAPATDDTFLARYSAASSFFENPGQSATDLERMCGSQKQGMEDIYKLPEAERKKCTEPMKTRCALTQRYLMHALAVEPNPEATATSSNLCTKAPVTQSNHGASGGMMLSAEGKKVFPTVGSVAAVNIEDTHHALLLRTGAEEFKFYQSWISEYTLKASPALTTTELCHALNGHYSFKTTFNKAFALGTSPNLYTSVKGEAQSTPPSIIMGLASPFYKPLKTEADRANYIKCFEIAGTFDTTDHLRELTAKIEACVKAYRPM